jgi:hypothetical protein
MWLASCSRSLENPMGQDAGGGGGPLFDPCVANPKPGYDPKSKNLTACCDTGPAHCVPDDQVLPKLASELTACPDGNSVCMPDPIIEGGGQFMPAACTSSVGNSAGVCLSQCIPLVANNPQSALLGQDGCGDGELCVPCKNPLSGASTGACDLIALLCTNGDGGTDGGGSGDGGQACPYTGPPLIDPTTLPACAPACSGAHCLPASTVPAGQQSLLTSCTAAGGVPGLCAPDELISTGGNFVPKSCTSVAGAEGRCLSTCLPSVSSEAAVLPDDVCAAGEKCVPCYNPTATDPNAPTGACGLACDKPSQPPLILTCPWTGPNVVEPTQFDACNPTCYGAHCVPSSLVPASLQSLLAACTDGFCTPDSLVAGGGFAVPKTCTSVAGAEGRCLSTCLPQIAGEAALLPVDVCDMGEVCAPCFDPTAADPTAGTGACTLACDKPTQPPVIITCPWSGPNVVDPSTFPDCSPACAGAHCIPADQVPTAQQALLASCGGGTGFCAPDAIIATADNFVPKHCASSAGVEGRCLSLCLPDIAAKANLLPQDVCAADERCAPCFDPTSTEPTPPPTGACSLGCDRPASSPSPLPCPYPSGAPDVVDPTQFPSCASATCSNAHCLPASLVPPAEQALLAACPGGGFCTPDPIIRTDNHFVPATCTSIAGAEGRCISTCLPSVAGEATLLPTAGCAAGEVCAPCYNPTAADPTAPTGACSLACDAPKKSPTFLTCQGEPPTTVVINPNNLPGCGCNGAHCLPSSVVPPGDVAQLATCSGGYCTPDGIIETAGLLKPNKCIPFAGVTPANDGRCLSNCLLAVSSNPTLEQSSCPTTEKCAPCWDPFSGAPSGACSLSTTCDAPPANAYTFPTCCVSGGTPGGRCIPKSQVPTAQQSNLQQDSCSSTNYLCVPNEDLPAPHNVPPGIGCNATALGFPYSGSCISNCVNLGVGGVFSAGNCATNGMPNHTCIPCFFAPAGSPGC